MNYAQMLKRCLDLVEEWWHNKEDPYYAMDFEKKEHAVRVANHLRKNKWVCQILPKENLFLVVVTDYDE